jgi:hypothetical protein
MDALIKEVKAIGGELADLVAVPGFSLKPFFANIVVTAGAKKGRLLDLGEKKSVVINSAHPMAKKLTDGKPGRAQVLVSAIISLVNRAEEKLTDEHQHELHRHLLLSMVS